MDCARRRAGYPDGADLNSGAAPHRYRFCSSVDPRFSCSDGEACRSLGLRHPLCLGRLHRVDRCSQRKPEAEASDRRPADAASAEPRRYSRTAAAPRTSFVPVSDVGKTIVARVIGRDPARNQTVTIDKGAAHGVKTDSAVITPAGVVGRVIQTSNFFSIVQLIVDSQSAVGVLVESTRRQGIVRGTGGRDLDLDYIDDDNDLKQGDMFLTSGLDRIYPKGLPLGVITSIGPRRGLLKTVQIRPTADLGRLEEVICVIQQAQNQDVADPAQRVSNPCLFIPVHQTA